MDGIHLAVKGIDRRRGRNGNPIPIWGYSECNATTGSILVARCAGMDIATSVTTATHRNAAAKDTKSTGGTRNKSLESNRVSAHATASPILVPLSIRIAPLRITVIAMP